ncbi:hypothetical protein OH77DRAFT_830328 [Trametes cingulata]|nr:hypothetical protein OH77DRAFT_830328 [Trametes cingulata]
MASTTPAPTEPSASASTSTPSAALDPRSDFIEQIFQKVEEESERRAQEQEEYEEQASRLTQSAMHSRVASPVPPAAPAAVSVVRDAAAAGVRERRRGSISVSRFGQVCPAFSPSPRLSLPSCHLSPTSPSP